MEIEVLRKTESPDKLFCEAARGDYYEGFIGDVPFDELIGDVDISSHIKQELVEDADSMNLEEISDLDISEQECVSEEDILEAKKRSFVERQISRGHYGPAEHAQITFAVKGVSRVTMAQITRHRHLTFDIQSMRYADFSEQEICVPPTLLSDEERHKRYPHIYDENGQHFNRDEGVFEMSEEKRADWKAMFINQREQSRRFYQYMVEAGIPKEDARFILPLGTTVNMTLSGNARTMLHLMDMRRKADAQWEIRELSELVADELREWMPITFNHYEQQLSKLSP